MIKVNCKPGPINLYNIGNIQEIKRKKILLIEINIIIKKPFLKQ